MRNDSVSVGATAVLLFDAANQNRPRKFFYIRNNSTAGQEITLIFGDEQAIAVNKGVVLGPTDSYWESIGENFEVWPDRIWAIGSAANGAVSVVERS